MRFGMKAVMLAHKQYNVAMLKWLPAEWKT
jgi:hypothetical protein